MIETFTASDGVIDASRYFDVPVKAIIDNEAMAGMGAGPYVCRNG